jgi:hypothetical protein
MDQFELERLWATVPGIEGVAFKFGDAVRVKSGEHAGEAGTVVALLSLVPIPSYTVELSLSGTSLALLQSQLEPAT